MFARIHTRAKGETLRIIIDGNVTGAVAISDSGDGGSKTYTLATGLIPSKPHQLTVWKATEDNGINYFHSFVLPQGGFLEPPQRPSRRLEFIGDSDTTGFCVSSASSNASRCQCVTDSYPTWSAELSRRFEAEMRVQAVSGWGVGAGAQPIQQVLDFTNGIAHRWDYSTWTPDAVVILIGANDLGGNFVTAYLSLLNQVATNYFNAKPVPPQIVHVCGGSMSGLDRCADIKKAHELFNSNASTSRGMRSHFTRMNQSSWQAINGVPGTEPFVINPEFNGCDGHYNEKGHRGLANVIAPQLAAVLGWGPTPAPTAAPTASPGDPPGSFRTDLAVMDWFTGYTMCGLLDQPECDAHAVFGIATNDGGYAVAGKYKTSTMAGERGDQGGFVLKQMGDPRLLGISSKQSGENAYLDKNPYEGTEFEGPDYSPKARNTTWVAQWNSPTHHDGGNTVAEVGRDLFVGGFKYSSAANAILPVIMKFDPSLGKSALKWEVLLPIPVATADGGLVCVGVTNYVADELPTKGALVKLLMGCNGIKGIKAGKALGNAIAANTVLKELDVSGGKHDGQKCDVEFFKGFSPGLSANGALTSLDVSGNKLEAKGAMYITAALRESNACVSKLDLTDNTIPNDESSNNLYQQLAELPLVHPSLVELSVAGGSNTIKSALTENLCKLNKNQTHPLHCFCEMLALICADAALSAPTFERHFKKLKQAVSADSSSAKPQDGWDRVMLDYLRKNADFDAANAEDEQQRSLLQIAEGHGANSELSAAIREMILFLGCYRVKRGPPAHKSATCIVAFGEHFALPSSAHLSLLGSDRARPVVTRVAMKFMKEEDQFERELAIRKQFDLDPLYVIQPHAPAKGCEGEGIALSYAAEKKYLAELQRCQLGKLLQLS
eukprot:g997.t1